MLLCASVGTACSLVDPQMEKEGHLYRLTGETEAEVKSQLESFLDAIRTGGPAAVDAEGGLAALRTALRVCAAMPDPDVDAGESR